MEIAIRVRGAGGKNLGRFWADKRSLSNARIFFAAGKDPKVFATKTVSLSRYPSSCRAGALEHSKVPMCGCVVD